MDKKLIEQLQNGEIAVKNDGTVEELKKVISLAFPKDIGVTYADRKYYFQWSRDTWIASYGKPSIKVVSIKDFFKDEWTPKFGEKILVSDDKKEWIEQYFISYQKEVKYPYFVVFSKSCINSLRAGNSSTISYPYKHAKPLKEETPEYTMEELTEKLGHTFKIKK